MHAYRFEIDGERWVIHANSGLTGEAIVVAPPGGTLSWARDPWEGRETVRLPAELLRQLGREAMREDVIRAVEEL